MLISFWARRRKRFAQTGSVPEETEERALDILGRLWERLTTIPVINYFPVRNQNLDEVLDIFVRVNSAGTVLSRTDLLFSTIVVQWDTGREAIEEFLKKINEKGNGFRFDTDFIMRACLVLTEGPIRLRVASFKADNVKLIVKDWKLITSAINRTADLLVEWGFEDATLPSANAVIPIAYAIKRGCDIRASKTDLRLLLIKSILTGVYGSSGDQVLSAMRKAVQEILKNDDAFDLAKFENKLRLPGGKSISINAEALDSLLDSTKGPRTFALLSLLSPHLKFSQVQFHQDHIHPYASFGSQSLRKLGIEDDVIRDWQEKRDALPNLQLLEGRENQAKLTTPFEAWLKINFPKKDGRDTYLRTQFIPDDLPLSLCEFGEFFQRRREVLKKQLGKVLNIANT